MKKSYLLLLCLVFGYTSSNAQTDVKSTGLFGKVIEAKAASFTPYTPHTVTVSERPSVFRDGGNECSSATVWTLESGGSGGCTFGSHAVTSANLSGFINPNGATNSTTTPAPSCGSYTSTDEDVWVNFTTPTGTNTIKILPSYTPRNTTGTATVADQDIYVQVYTGTCGSLTAVGCFNIFDWVNAGGGSYDAFFSTYAVAGGTSVYLRFWEADGDNAAIYGVGVEAFSTAAASAPSNNECSGATVVSLPTPGTCETLATAYPKATVPFCLKAATTSAQTSSCGTDPDVWYQITLPPSGSVLFDVEGELMTASTTCSYCIANEALNLSVFTSCTTGNEAQCNALTTSGGSYYTRRYDGTPGATVYVRVSENSGSTSLEGLLNIIPLPTQPTNADCSTAGQLTGSGCNYGSASETWAGPSATIAQGGANTTCSGNSWSSVDNPVYYTIDPTASSATITVENIVCNGGESGLAQFGVWAGCSVWNSGGPYQTGEFLGCAAGTGTVTLSLTGLDPNLNYTLVVDGNAGDNCRWDFQGSGVVITPVELTTFSGKLQNKQNSLSWSTASEQNNSHFVVERSTEGRRFTQIGIVQGKGNTSEVQHYAFLDSAPSPKGYYRLKQVDFDGKFVYSKTILLERKATWREFAVYPSPLRGNTMTLAFESDTQQTQEMDLRIVDVYGKTLFRQSLLTANSNTTHEITLENLPKGIYFAVLSNGSELATKKIVKQD